MISIFFSSADAHESISIRELESFNFISLINFILGFNAKAFKKNSLDEVCSLLFSTIDKYLSGWRRLGC